MAGRSLSGAAAALAALVLAAAIGLGGGSAAAADSAAEERPVVGTFKLEASNGYSILGVAPAGRAGDQSFVVLFVVRSGRGAIYRMPAEVTATTIRADLGALGAIDLEFVPGTETTVVPSPCGGNAIEYAAGAYVGSFRFRGEGGYTAVEAERAPYAPGLLASFVCGPLVTESEGFGPGLPGARLTLFSRRQGRTTTLQVNKNSPRAKMRFEARTSERRGKVNIDRYVTGGAGAGSFAFARSLRTATLRPPSPFSGGAEFHRNASRARRWTGDLAIDFPGRPQVRLTGSRFRVGLVRARLSRSVYPEVDAARGGRFSRRVDLISVCESKSTGPRRHGWPWWRRGSTAS